MTEFLAILTKNSHKSALSDLTKFEIFCLFGLYPGPWADLLGHHRPCNITQGNFEGRKMDIYIYIWGK